MFSKENYNSIRNLEPKKIILNEKFASLARKMDFYLTISASTFPCFYIIYNPGQNIWQKWHFIPLSPISMLFAPIHVFLREDFPENSYIDIRGGTSVPNN